MSVRQLANLDRYSNYLILHNAKVLTMDPANPRAQAVVVDGDDGRIVWVGADADAADLRGGQVQRIDMAGRTVVPGFNDCHMHILPYGLDLTQADLSPSAGVTDVPSLIQALRRWHDRNPQSEWVLGSRYDQNTFPGAAHPTRQQLDTAFPNHPVYVVQTSKHAAAANSIALRLAGITHDTPNPPGGEIVRDAAGEPTGLLLENAMELMGSTVPLPDRPGLVAAVKRACDALAQNGITSASDLHTGWHDRDEEISIYQQAAEEGAAIRMTLYPYAAGFGAPDQIPSRSDFASQSKIQNPGSGIRLGPLKLYADGALTTRTAALREPFIDTGSCGMLLHPEEELRAYIAAADSAGWQVATHAIGDRAIELVLDAYRAAGPPNPPITGGTIGNSGAQRETVIASEAMQSPGDSASTNGDCFVVPPRNDSSPSTCSPRYRGAGGAFRHRIEHAMLLDEGLIARFAAEGVIPVMQPEFVARLGDAYVLGLGEERAARLNPVASLLRAGVGVPFSSDCPIVPGAPLDGIRSAARRVARSGRILGAGERIPPAEALRCYTYWAAYATHDEVETGTITPGKRADLTVLSADPTSDELDSVEVVATIAGGAVIYGSV